MALQCRRFHYRGNLSGMTQSAGAGMPGRLSHDFPLSTLLAHSLLCSLDLRDTVLKCLGAKFDLCNQQPTPVGAFLAINKVATTPRKTGSHRLFTLHTRKSMFNVKATLFGSLMLNL